MSGTLPCPECGVYSRSQEPVIRKRQELTYSHRNYPAYKAAMIQHPSQIASELQGALGQKLVAYATGVRSAKLVGRWATGTQPRHESEKRLRDLYRVYITLHQHEYSDGTIRAFLSGSNPDLRDQTPIDVIREGHGVDAFRAAEAFVA